MKFKVHVTRIGYRHKDFFVEAVNNTDAAQQARELAGNTSFPAEYQSDYEFGDPIPIPDTVACNDCGWIGTTEDEGFVPLSECKHLGERLDPGHPVPVGECPKCRAFAY